MLLVVVGSSALAQAAAPAGSSVFVSAASWVEGTMLGTIATAVAVIAVASVGLLMLSGRLDARRGLIVVAGCFILFGARSLVDGLQAALTTDGANTPHAAEAPVPPARIPDSLPSGPNPDPYAGATVPRR
jgi:type IV secretory pathway VirB2 component (pilin)